MAFYTPNAAKYAKAHAADDEEDTSSYTQTGKSDKSGFYVPSATNYAKVYQKQQEEEEERKQAERVKQDQIRKDQEEKNKPNYLNMAGGFLKSVGEAIAAPFKRIGEGTAETINETSGQAQQQRNLKAEQDTEDIALIRSLGDKIKNAKTDEEKQRYRDALKKVTNISTQQDRNYQARQDEIIERTDPVKGAAAVGEIGLNVISGGSVGAMAKAAQVAKTGLAIERGGKVAKVAKDIAETVISPSGVKKSVVSGATQGAAFGGLATTQEKGGNATAEDYAKGIGIGAASGGVLGGAAAAIISKLTPVGQKVFQKATTSAEERLGRELTDDELNIIAGNMEKNMPEMVSSTPNPNIETPPIVPETPKRMSSVSTEKVMPDTLTQKNQPTPPEPQPKPIEAPQKPVSSKKELSQAVDAHIYETEPHLFQPKETGRVFNEGSTKDIPSMHVDDVKKYFGTTEDLPNIYKRTGGEKDIDLLAQRAGYDDVDQFVADIQQELVARKSSRESTQRLAELRKDPDVIAAVQKKLDDERAAYGADETFTPSKSDEKELLQAKYGEGAKPTKNEAPAAPDELPKDYKGNRRVRGDTASGNALRLEQNALEKKLTDNLGDLAEYKSINMKDQAEKAIKIVNEDRQRAIDIIDGKANPPGNLKAQSIHQALEEIAVQDGDIGLLQKLAKSHVNRELSESAQNLRIAAERDPNSAVENIRQLQDIRKGMAEKRSGTTVAKEAQKIKGEIEKRTPKATKQDWASFVEELQCR